MMMMTQNVGDHRVDLEGLADRFAGLRTQQVEPEAAKVRPCNDGKSQNRSWDLIIIDPIKWLQCLFGVI